MSQLNSQRALVRAIDESAPTEFAGYPAAGDRVGQHRHSDHGIDGAPPCPSRAAGALPPICDAWTGMRTPDGR